MQNHFLIPYKDDSGIPPYLPFPRFLIPLDLSNDAKVLYALLFDRAGISRENGYIDPNGRIRLYFTVEEAMFTKNLQFGFFLYESTKFSHFMLY